nr:ribonuclease T(2) [Actinomycetes bacterium]
RVADRASDLQKDDMPSVKLPADVRTDLEAVMSDVALMAPHEWYTHGTCSDVTPSVYFSDAVALTGEARRILDPLFQQAQGQRLSPGVVRDRFDAEFGAGAGERVGLVCGQVDGEGTVVNDVHLSLPPVADLRAGEGTLPLEDLLTRGPAIPEGCSTGTVP